MKYNIWHDGNKDENGVNLWWVEAVEQDGFLRVTQDVPLLLAEEYVAGVIADDDIVCERDFTAGEDLCCTGADFKADWQKTQAFRLTSREAKGE